MISAATAATAVLMVTAGQGAWTFNFLLAATGSGGLDQIAMGLLRLWICHAIRVRVGDGPLVQCAWRILIFHGGNCPELDPRNVTWLT